MFEASRPEDLAFEVLKAEALQSPEGLDPEYSIGFFKHSDSAESFEVAIIACVGLQKVLVAFPTAAWDKKSAKRKLPPQTLEKPLAISVGACFADSRSEAADSVHVNVWIGWLKRDLFPFINFEQSETATFRFVSKEREEECFPLAAALAAVAEDKFSVPVSVPPEEVDRLSALENQFAVLKTGLDELLQIHRQRVDAGFHTPGEESMDGPARVQIDSKPKFVEATSKRKAALKKKPVEVPPPPGLQELSEYPGLDPGTVAAALQAGVPPEHLQVMSEVLVEKPKKLSDYPRASTSLTAVVESEDSSEEEAALQDGQKEEIEASDPMTSALLKLTAIVGKLSKKKDSLTDNLELGGSGSGEVSSSLGRKHAAVRKALQQTFKQEPSKIWKIVEANMLEDYQLQAVAPNTGGGGFTVRGWAEHRSKIQAYPREVRWVWGTAGALDALRAGNVDQARTRLCLMLAAAEQEALDLGSPLLSQEFSLEPPAPVSSFSSHVIPDPTEMAMTKLLEQHWIESLADRLKQVDAYVEVRKKLGQRTKGPPAFLEKGAKGKVGKDGKGKGASDAPAAEN